MYSKKIQKNTSICFRFGYSGDVNRNITPKTSVAELIQMLANATTTGATCGGHKKSHFNDIFCEDYETRLKELGAIIPDKSELYRLGKFNGIGAF